MTRLILLPLLLIAALASAAIGEQTQRRAALPALTDEIAADFTAVGRVNQAGFKTKSSCSGTLIRPDVVLTAGHCASRRHDPSSQKTFVAGWSRGDYVAARQLRNQMKHPAYGIGGTHDPRFDVGLLFLAEPITEVAPIPLGPVSGGDVAILGYHRFIPHLLSGAFECPVLTEAKQILEIGCPVVSGNSGGPVLEPDGQGGWVLTAVVSSTTGTGALATRVPQWVYDVLETEQP